MLTFLDFVATEARFAARSLLRSKRLLLAASVALALGIGANVTIFTFADGLLLRPLPYESPEELVSLGNNWAEMGYEHTSMSLPEILDHRRLDSYQAVSAHRLADINFTAGSGDPESLTGSFVSSNLFDTLGVSAHRGRTFDSVEGRTDGARAAIISYGLWQRRFGDEEVVGKSASIAGERYTIIGVMPANFGFPQPAVDIWLPVRLGPDVRMIRGSRMFNAVARLAPGVSLERLRSELKAFSTTVQEEHADHYRQDYGFSFGARGLQDHTVRSVKPALLLLLGASGVIALIACSNVANLFLCQLIARSRSLSMRRALGATSARIASQLFFEAVGVAATAGVLGAAVAAIGRGWLMDSLPSRFTAEAASFDLRIFAFTVVLSLAAALLVSAISLPRALSTDALGALRTKQTAGNASRIRTGLVIGQTALAVALVMTTFLLGRSLREMVQVDLGFVPGQKIAASIALDSGEYEEPEKVARFYDQVLEGLSQQSSVASAGLVSILPLRGTSDWAAVVEGSPTTTLDELHFPQFRVASPNYFEALQIPLLEGRTIATSDREDAAAVVVINRTFADRFYPSGSLGKRVKLGGLNSASPWMTIVGVVGDTYENSLDQPPQATIFRPLWQAPQSRMTAVFDPRGAAGIEVLRDVVRRVDPDQALSEVLPLRSLVSESSETERLLALLLTVFSLLALGLAVLGVYGVLVFMVEQERPALGVRLALGARSSDIIRIVLVRGAVLAVGGASLGGLIYVIGSRALANFLFGVGTLDPLAAALTLTTLAVATVGACWFPARQALRTDPLTVLKSS